MGAEETSEKGERGIRRSLGRMLDSEGVMERELLSLVETHGDKEPRVCAVCRGRDPDYQTRYYVLIGRNAVLNGSNGIDKYLELVDMWRKCLKKQKFEISLRVQPADLKEAKNYGICIWPSNPMLSATKIFQ